MKNSSLLSTVFTLFAILITVSTPKASLAQTQTDPTVSQSSCKVYVRIMTPAREGEANAILDTAHQAIRNQGGSPVAYLGEATAVIQISSKIVLTQLGFAFDVSAELLTNDQRTQYSGTIGKSLTSVTTTTIQNLNICK